MSRDVLASVPTIRRFVYRLVFLLGPRVPLIPARTIGWLGGLIWWYLDGHGRRIVAANLRVPCRRRQRELGVWVRRTFCRAGLGVAEGLQAGRYPAREAAPDRFRILDPARQTTHRPVRGPIVFATPHCNWELIPPLTRQVGFVERVHVISLSHDDPVIDDLFYRARAASGVVSILLDRAPLAALRALKDGAVFGIVADRDYTGHGLAVPLFGRLVSLPVGPATLAVQAGIPVIPVLMARVGWTRCLLVICPPLHPDRSRPKRAQIEELTRGIGRHFERFITTVPDQWQAFHPFWSRL